MELKEYKPIECDLREDMTISVDITWPEEQIHGSC